MHSIEVFLTSEIDDDSFEAVEIQQRLSRIRAYVPSTSYERTFEIRGNWSDDNFTLSVPEKFLESRFPLRLQAQFPGGSKLSVEAKVFMPTRVDLKLITREYIEGVVAHEDFSGRSVNAAAVGCELTCPGTKQKITGNDTCITCSNSRGKRFKLCC